MMSYLLRGTAADLDMVGSISKSLSKGLQDSGYSILQQVARVPGIWLMGAPGAAVQHATQQVRSRVRVNSDLHLCGHN